MPEEVTPRVLIAATIPPYKSTDTDPWEALAWLSNIDDLTDDAWDAGADPLVFAALEVDQRGLHVHSRVLDKFRQLSIPATHWTFSIDDDQTEVSSAGRLHRICAGRNLIHEYALVSKVDWILFLDSDIQPDAATVSKLLAMNYPIVGGDIREYCLKGDPVTAAPVWTDWKGDLIHGPGTYDFPVQSHWNTAGYLMVHRDVFRQFRWGHDAYDSGLTDDPWTQNLALRSAGYHTLVRKDCVGKHKPLRPMEERGHDRRLVL